MTVGKKFLTINIYNWHVKNICYFLITYASYIFFNNINKKICASHMFK